MSGNGDHHTDANDKTRYSSEFHEVGRTGQYSNLFLEDLQKIKHYLKEFDISTRNVRPQKKPGWNEQLQQFNLF